MSSLLTNLSERLRNSEETETIEYIIEYFRQSTRPYEELLDFLTKLSETYHSNNQKLIHYLLQSFLQYKNQSKNTLVPDYLNRILIKNLVVKFLPIDFLNDFCKIYQISKNDFLNLLRSSLTDSTSSTLYKRALNIIVKFQYQLDFDPNEILLPLILNTKDQFIHIFIDNKFEINKYVLDILNHLYTNGGKKLRDILIYDYHISNPIINKKALGRLATRYWNSLPDNEKLQYRNLVNLQHTRALGYLINVKYSGNSEEKTMSDEAWNESIEEILKNSNDEVADYFFESLINRNDLSTVNYWLNQLKRPLRSLPIWMQRAINNNRQPNCSTTVISNRKSSIDYYQITSKDVEIIFIDSRSTYDRLFDRLFHLNNEDEHLCIGFDCEWKPIYNNLTGSKERISIMQMAFPNQIFLLDVLDFFHQCDTEIIQKRLANRLFDDDHMTILCYGSKSDISMLIASYPVFDQALSSSKTLLDLCLVQTDLMTTQREIFPYAKKDSDPPSKDKGLSELVRLCFGKALNKSEQCSNWEKRPLRDAQISYAATDAYCLLDIYNFLNDRLQSTDYLQSFRGKRIAQAQSTNEPITPDPNN